MAGGQSRRVVDFETVQRANASGRGNTQGSSNGMEVEAMRRMVKRWEDDQKTAVAVTDQDPKMAKVIHESGWKVRYEYDTNHTERRWTAIAKNFHRRATAVVRAGEAILGLVQSPPLLTHRP
jgi:hypothetical protein